MLELLTRLWPLKRSLVSDGYDEALKIIARYYDIKVSSYPSGTECWTWTIPDKWTCHDAYLETLDGKRVIDYKDHPLHCMDYSLPVDKVVDREELFNHLYVHEKNPDAIPYIFKFYERDWGLCCTRNVKDSLTDSRYKVVIKTEFSKGKLKVGQLWLQGKTDNIFVIMAHLCHPYLANDDLSGVVVGLELMKQLKSMEDRNYSYLLLLVPETIGSVAWLSHNEEIIPKIKGGLFLEMLGHNSPHALQRSYQGNTQVDLSLEYVLKEMDGNAYCRNFSEIIRNDELEFNSPSFRIPMLSLSRCLPPESDSFPYPEYHTHFDHPDIIKEQCLQESLDLAFNMLKVFDKNIYPKAKFKGQVFCSKYGLYPKELDQYLILMKVMFDLDGKHSVIDICNKHNLRLNDVYKIINSFIAHDLVEVIFY